MDNNILYWNKCGKDYKCYAGDFVGSILSKKELEAMFSGELISHNIPEIEYAKDIGLSIEISIQKYKNKTYNTINIKNNSEFVKVFKMNNRELLKDETLNEKCWCFIAKTEPFIYFPTNSVVIDGKNPTIKDLMKFMKYSESKMYETLKLLEDAEVIKRVKLNGQNIIYYNPFLYCAGKSVLKDVYYMFEDSKYNM